MITLPTWFTETVARNAHQAKHTRGGNVATSGNSVVVKRERPSAYIPPRGAAAPLTAPQYQGMLFTGLTADTAGWAFAMAANSVPST